MKRSLNIGDVDDILRCNEDTLKLRTALWKMRLDSLFMAS